ncbi:hypothetical protein GPALN_009762 [Globodera pallida]|nr:hypothetical protein GPALN_009762 [Globodera pallida]
MSTAYHQQANGQAEDEPLKWERYVDDPNLEQEEAEEKSEEEGMTADDQEERNANENGQRVKAKLDKSMAKYGLEESEEEEETTIAFVRGNENRENESELEILGQNDIEREEEEFGTITEILLEGEAMTAYTAWPDPTMENDEVKKREQEERNLIKNANSVGEGGQGSKLYKSFDEKKFKTDKLQTLLIRKILRLKY